MRKILSIALINFVNALKEKIFVGIVFFFIFLLSLSLFLAKLGVGESIRVLRNMGLVGIEITGLILIVFGFISSFYREKENKILEVYLSFLSRPKYIFAKLLGYIMLIITYLIFASVGYGIILIFKSALSIKLFSAIFPIFLKLNIVLFFTLLFSVIFNSSFVCLFSTIFIYVTSELSKSSLEWVVKWGNKFQIFIFKWIYRILPNFDKLDIKTQAVYEKVPDMSFFFYITIYSLIYLAFLYVLSYLVFRRKEW